MQPRRPRPGARKILAVALKISQALVEMISRCGGSNGAQNMLITEQLPNLVHEQVNAISNLKIDKITVWDSGKNADGKTGTADFLSGLVGALPPLHELACNAGLDLPTYLGKLQEAAQRQSPLSSRAEEKPEKETSPRAKA